MNRQQRRAQKPKHGKALLIERIERNGITEAELEKAHKQGYAEGIIESSTPVYKMCLAAASLALHRNFGFGRERCVRFLNAMFQEAMEHIVAEQAADEVMQELGIDLCFDQFNVASEKVQKDVKGWEM